MILAARVALAVILASGVTWVGEHVYWLASPAAFFAVDGVIEWMDDKGLRL